MKRLLLVFTPLLLLVFSGCEKEETTERLSSEVLIGEWERTYPDDIQYYAGQNYKFEFKESSFTLQLNIFTDAIVPDAPCASNRTYFISGRYEILKGDRMRFFGEIEQILDFQGAPTCKDEKGNDYFWETAYFYDGSTLTLDADAEWEEQMVFLVKN
jgi:hypothetical protein